MKSLWKSCENRWRRWGKNGGEEKMAARWKSRL